MQRSRIAALAVSFLFCASAAFADPVSVGDLRRHVDILASDDYQGRKPGTEGEGKTLLYIASQLQRLGLEPAAGSGSWYQPVGLVSRKPFAHRALWTSGTAPVALGQQDLILIGREPQVSLPDAPVLFVRHGLAADLAGLDLKDSVALIVYAQPKNVAGAPNYAERARMLADAGAAAVIAIYGDDIPWSAIAGYLGDGQTRLQTETGPRLSGAMPQAAAQRLFDAAGATIDNAAAGPIGVRASLDVSTEVRPFDSHNIVGRLRGSGKSDESVLFLAHWDHLGICRAEGAADRICNGAVDNASGIAAMIEIARGLAKGKRPKRDILFMGTTAEEMGLLGAQYFGKNPVVPARSIVAALNMDTVAISPKGTPVAIIGRGDKPIDDLIARTAAELGRTMDNDGEADSFVTRQDGYMLSREGIPTVMVGGSFSNMNVLQAFLAGPYHKPDDDLKRDIVLDGAAEDSDLMIALARKLADPKRYQRAAK